MLKHLITLLFVALLSGITGTGFGILTAPAAGTQTRQHLSALVAEHRDTLLESLEGRGRIAANALEFLTSRVKPNKNSN